jgi:hypothetical protein
MIMATEDNPDYDEYGDWDPILCANLKVAMDYLDDFMNEQRNVYIVKHRKILKFYPTCEFDKLSDEDMLKGLNTALDGGKAKPLAYRRKAEAPSLELLAWDQRRCDDLKWNLPKDEPNPENYINTTSKRILVEWEAYFNKPDVYAAKENLEAIDVIRDDLANSLKVGADDKRQMKMLQLVPHTNASGKPINCIDVMSLRAKGALVSLTVSLGAMRITKQYVHAFI